MDYNKKLQELISEAQKDGYDFIDGDSAKFKSILQVMGGGQRVIYSNDYLVCFIFDCREMQDVGTI